MTNTHKDNKPAKRVPIADYGKAAKAQKAKEEMKQFMKSTRVEK